MIDKYQTRKLSQDTDRIETVSFYSRTGETTFSSPYTLYRVKRNAFTQELTAGGRLATQKFITFRFYQSDLNQASAPNPKTTDRITDSNNITYNVLGPAEFEMVTEVWVLRDCQQLVGVPTSAS